MFAKHIERMFWVIAVSAIAWTSVWASNRDDTSPQHNQTAIPLAQAGPASFTFDTLLAAGTIVVERNPFRLERRSSDVWFQNRDAVQPAAEPLPEAQPVLKLALIGVVGGAHLSALIDGIPEQAGSRLLQEGERFGDLLIKTITYDSVTVQWADTTWTLKLKRLW